MIARSQIAGLILAGGKASRMNYRDKALLPLHDKPLIQHVRDHASPQVAELLVSVNRAPEKYTFLNLPLIPDQTQPFAGPLLGIHSGMLWLQAHRQPGTYSHLACFAADVPYFPADLVANLATALDVSGNLLAVCRCEAQLQPLFSLWSLDSLPAVGDAIASGLYGPKLMMSQFPTTTVEIEKQGTQDFYNVNSEANLMVLARETKPL